MPALWSATHVAEVLGAPSRDHWEKIEGSVPPASTRNSGDGSFKTGDALTDIVMTLALMVGLRLAEEEGLL